MANLSTLQGHIDVLKSNNPESKKKALTPDSIADVKKFIAQERADRKNGTHETLEPTFIEWEQLINKYESEKGQITSATASATATTAANVAESASGKKTPEQLQSELESSLAEFSEQDFESIKNTIEKATKLIEGFEKLYPEYREAMRGSLGLMILERLSKAGYRINLSASTINITPNDIKNQAQATQMETYFRGQNMTEVFALGMVYRSSEIKNYSDIYITGDKKDIKPGQPRNYLDYMRDAQKNSPQSKTPADEDLQKSQIAIQSILSNPQKVKGIIIGTPFLATAIDAVRSDPALAQSVNQAVTQLGNNTSTDTRPQSVIMSSSSGSSMTRPPGWSEDPINRTLSEVGQGFSGGLSKLMSTPGAFGGLILVTIATMIFSGFKNGLKVFGGGIGLSAAMDIFNRNKDGMAQTAQTATNAVAGAANSAAQAAGVSTGPAAGAETTAPLTPFQIDLRKKVEASSIGTDIEKLTNITGSKYPGKLDDYLKFIETDLKDIPLSKLFPSDHKKSIFFDNFDTDFSVDNKLSGKMLKKVLREYLTGNQALTGTGDKLGEKEQNDFLTLHKITPADIQNKKLSDILGSVHTVRVGSATTQAPAQAPANTLLTKHKIGNVDVDVGKNVQTNIMALVYGPDGKEYANLQSKLPKDKNQKLYIPKDGVVKLGASILKISGVDHVEVEYKGEKMYAALSHLKP